jgi:predicted extracellular nuclease
MRSAVITLALFLLASPARALPIFSEYIEGSGQNQAVEIFNPDPSALSLSGWTLELYRNGASAPSQVFALAGSIAAGDVFVVARSGADPAVLAVADMTFNQLNFNGDDALVLANAGTPVDRIGRVGEDPGQEWGSGLTSTQNNTLQRDMATAVPNSDPTAPFDPALEWTGSPADTFADLGAPPAIPVPEPSPHSMLLGLLLALAACYQCRR